MTGFEHHGNIFRYFEHSHTEHGSRRIRRGIVARASIAIVSKACQLIHIENISCMLECAATKRAVRLLHFAACNLLFATDSLLKQA